jgi:HlyD family secretion protein
MNAPDTNPPASGSTPPMLSTAEVQNLLKGAVPRAWWLRTGLWISVVVLVLMGGGAYFWQMQQVSKAAPVYVTEAAAKGNLTLNVSANGTLQPTRSVSIGSELSGTVLRVLVDVNDKVKKGQVLVELDTAKLNDQVARSRANLASAIASVAQAGATLTEMQGNLARLEEVARLSGGKVPSQAELATGQAAVERALAAQTSARANVAVVQATLSTDSTNLSRASIRSSIDGVVLTRTVDPGNAVAASLQAVTLFTIAEDLRKMGLQVSVDEADVGAVQAGQKASFTVSAYPARKFPAVVTRVAFGSTMTDNVVTYQTNLEVDNADLSLRPGMTASSTITSVERRDVLLVPNTALRFAPTQAGSAAPDKSKGGILSSLLPRMSGGGARKSAGGNGPAKHVWVLRDGAPVNVPVVVGISDGRMTEITGSELKIGMLLITDQRTGGAAKAAP